MNFLVDKKIIKKTQKLDNFSYLFILFYYMYFLNYNKFYYFHYNLKDIWIISSAKPWTLTALK